MPDYVIFKFPLDLLSTLAGGVVGFVLVFVVDWVRRPRVKFLGFAVVESNFGDLYKLRFQLRGCVEPGLCRMTIQWCCKSVFAKWDETPNPLENDNLSKFKPELVPATYDQPLFFKHEYAVPLVIKNEGKSEIFSGWWFGKDKGYGPDPGIYPGTEIRVVLSGGGLSWSKTITLAELVNAR
ncbi:MAG: hypothetical protein KZQ76_08650 [Candidatus Thiodiazotropha sp. (ex Epidulcina cf. delphinae)]|nr:hypothetical protein [Candidatus Thiodiazotropha sp. (ex Epidulcina cf. delphinae)]